MVKTLSFCIVFHQRLFYSNTKDFTREEIEKYFLWIGVNEKIPKQIADKAKDYPILYEYKMPHHCPLFQMLNFYQNSVFFHLARNPDLIPCKYIGFGQYDMKIQADKFRAIANLLENDTADKIIGVFPYDFITLYNLLNPQQWKEYFLKPYNEFYGTSHTLEALQPVPLFLLHTFILPKWFFLHMMRFVEHLLPTTLKMLNWDTKHLAGTLERIFALCISCGIVEGKFRHLFMLEGMTHEGDQHEADELRGIQKGSFQDD